MDTDVAVEDGYSFTLWLRTGRLVRRDALGAGEVKFNPNHDPKDGRITFGSGASSAGMSRRSKPVAPQVTGKTWNGGGFTGDDGWVGPSLYKDDGTQVRYFDSGETDLVDAPFDAWHIEPPDK